MFCKFYQRGKDNILTLVRVFQMSGKQTCEDFEDIGNQFMTDLKEFIGSSENQGSANENGNNQLFKEKEEKQMLNVNSTIIPVAIVVFRTPNILQTQGLKKFSFEVLRRLSRTKCNPVFCKKTDKGF